MPALFVALAILVIDQLTKFTILKNLFSGESIPVIKNVFHISLVFNRGFAFGLFSRATSLVWICIYSFTVGIIIFILFFYKDFFRYSKFTQVSLALILGGAIGNLIDRIRFGYVIDFLDFRIWPVFNIADSAITIGTALLVLQILRHKQVKRT